MHLGQVNMAGMQTECSLQKNPPAGRFSCCFMSWKLHCYCHKELKPSNSTDKCFFSTLVLNILYYRSLFFSCHISVQKLSNPLQLYHDTEPDQISESRYPDTQILHHSIYNALQLTVQVLSLASTLIVLLFKVDIYLFYFKSESKSLDELYLKGNK